MQISVKQLPKSTVQITIEAEEKDLAPARKQALFQLSKEVKIDGFREGNIPENVLIEKVGEQVVQRETLDIAIKLLYFEAVKKEHLKVVSQPKVEVLNAVPLKFTATVTVSPEVKLGDYKKIKLKKEKVSVEKKDIEAVIADVRKRNQQGKTIKDRSAKKGDRVEIDFTGSTPDGVPLDGTNSKNHPIVIGEGNFIPGFEEGVIGMKTGEEKEHTVKFPADYGAKHLAGKDVKFKIKLHKIEELTDPELNDEFAKKVSGGKKSTWKEVESDISEYLKSSKESQANQKLENDLINELLKICKVETPDALIDEEIEFMLKDLHQRLSQGGMTWEKYLEQSKKTEDSIKKELRPEAEKRVNVRLILDKLVEVEKVEADDKDIKAKIERMKANYPESKKKEVDETFAVGTPNYIRLRQQLKVIKLLGELIKKLSS